MEKPTVIELEFGESLKSVLKRYPMLRIEKQPAGLNFYTLNWTENKPATFHLKQGNLEIPFVISIMLTEDVDRISEGVTSIDLGSGITYDKKISHDEARLKFYNFLQGLLAKGWKRTISLSDPRISGAQSMHYLREHESFYSPDINYLPSLKEWRALRALGTYWELHTDDNRAFIRIGLERKDIKTDSDTGIYLISIEIKNLQEELRSHFSSEEKRYWNDQKKWDETKVKLLSIRAKREKDLLSKGYMIDESFEDYNINPPSK